MQCGVVTVLLLAAAGEGLRDQPLIVAHRGASHAAPENTLAAFRLAWELGADAIEGDFHLTRDGVVVCLHDKGLRKTAGVNRLVRDCTMDELREMEVGSWKSEKYAGEPIPTLAEVLDCVEEGKILLIELKAGPEIVPPMLAAIDASAVPLDQLRVIAFDSRVIAAVEKARPALRTYWLSGLDPDPKTRWRPATEQLLRTLEECQADGLDVHAAPRIDARFVRSLRDAGHEFHVWTVNDRPLAHYFAELGVDSITTNHPRVIREGLDEPSTPRPLLRARLDGDVSFEGDQPVRGRVIRSPGSTGPAECSGVWGGALQLRGRSCRLRASLPLPGTGTMGAWFCFEPDSRAIVQADGDAGWRLEFDARERSLRWVTEGGEEHRSSVEWSGESGWRWVWWAWDLGSGRRTMGVGAQSTEWRVPVQGPVSALVSWTVGDGGPRDGAWDDWVLASAWWVLDQRQAWVAARPR